MPQYEINKSDCIEFQVSSLLQNTAPPRLARYNNKFKLAASYFLCRWNYIKQNVQLKCILIIEQPRVLAFESHEKSSYTCVLLIKIRLIWTSCNENLKHIVLIYCIMYFSYLLAHYHVSANGDFDLGPPCYPAYKSPWGVDGWNAWVRGVNLSL